MKASSAIKLGVFGAIALWVGQLVYTAIAYIVTATFAFVGLLVLLMIWYPSTFF